MPRDVVALVSADDFVSAVRVYADRINDLLRRNGVPALEAIEISETYALALLDALVNAPETVIDLAGWWFARAIELTSRQVGSTDAEVEEPISMLAGTAGEEQVRAALATLSDSERAAVMLRDGYDLPAQAVGVALRRGTESATELAAAGRLHLVAAYDGRRSPDLAGHTGRTTVDLLALSQLADGSLESPRAAPLRRHIGNCSACEDVTEALAKGRRLAAGLPIIAMDDDARLSLIDRVAARAISVLPSHDEVLRVVDEDHDPGPTVSPVLVIFVLVLALVLGVVLAALIQSDTTPNTPASPPVTIQPSVSAAFPTGAAIKPPHIHPSSAPPTRILTTPAIPGAGHSSKPTKSPVTTTSPPQAATPKIDLSPTSGKSGTTFAVFGSGFPPDTTVTLSYATGRSTSTAEVDSNGDFTGQLRAATLLPGNRRVSATDGSVVVTATFVQRL